MIKPKLRLDRFQPPVQNASGGYEYAIDIGLQRFVVEMEAGITQGLDELRAQAMLRALLPRIEKAARDRHFDQGGVPESRGAGELQFRIILSAKDLN